jgi:Domain of unknown function (DUF4902)
MSRHSNQVVIADAPICYSHDFYVRVTQRDLPLLQLNHQGTDWNDDVLRDALHIGDPPTKVMVAGMTEWAVPWGTAHVSLGWDWALHRGGEICAIQLLTPRSNLLILDHFGYDPDFSENSRRLWALIDTIAWRTQIEKLHLSS